ncbi:MAG: tetratricopeptide repeat protein [Dehalococcoidia bacterium]
MKLPLVLPAGAVLLLLTGCSRPSAQRLNADGNHAYARADYPTALEDYRKAQVERPDLTTLNYNAGNVLHQQGEYQRGITESLRATRGGVSDTQVRAFDAVGSDYYREGKLKEALDAFKNALRVDPSDIDAKYNVEVIQRRLDKEAAQNQQNQAAQPTPTPTAQTQSGQSQGRPPQQGQQPGQQPPQGQSAGQQPPPGQQPGQQPKQGQSGQPGQAGQSAQPTPNGQVAQPGQGQAGGGQPGNLPPSGSTAPGSTGTPVSPADTRAQQQQLNKDLQGAVDAYQKGPTIDEALRILDILAEQERITQAEQGIRSDPRSGDK